tara:strand:+ start:31220 stop:32263 length:1044 start_codon:yes stop_codon:yes gene_type:complete
LKKKVDFIIVGQGIAGTSLAFKLLQKKYSILVIDKYNPNSTSSIALGLYNPLVLKWFTKSWEVDNQLKDMFDYLYEFEKKFNTKINFKKNIHKLLYSTFDQNNWLEKQVSPKKSPYMSKNLKFLDNIIKPFGVVKKSGWVDVKLMLDTFRNYLSNNLLISDEHFIHEKLNINDNSINYKQYMCKYLVFCEGSAVIKNSFFNYLDFKMTKGEVINFFSPNLKINEIIHSGVTTIPLGDDNYIAGSTFNHDLKYLKCTVESKNEIIKKIKKIKDFTFVINSQSIAVRPSVFDRRPIIGPHYKYKNIFLMNGLGSRGVLMTSYLANILLSNIFRKEKINSDINVNRFNKI